MLNHSIMKGDKVDELPLDQRKFKLIVIGAMFDRDTVKKEYFRK
jgi:hypothetical protein